MSKTPRPVFDNATNDLSKPCVESVRVSLRPSLCCSRWSADLDGFGRASAVVTEPAEAAKPVEVKKRIPGNPKERLRSRIR